MPRQTVTFLPKEFVGNGEVAGFRFKQLQASQKAYLYEVTSPYGEIRWEVIKRRVSQKTGQEMYPRGKTFSRFAISCTNRDLSDLWFQMMSDIG